MVADDPVRRLCLGKLRSIPAQLLCIILVLIQATLVNHHLAVASEEKIGRWQWCWFVADAAVVIAFIASFYLREWRLEPVAAKHKDPTGFSKGLPFGSLSWLLYAILLGARIAVIFKKDLQEKGEIGDLKLTICITAITCVFFTMGHHHRHESLARRAAILALVKMFTIDLLDTVDVLDVLFVTAKDNPNTFPLALEDIVLAVVTLNLARPAMVFFSLFIDHYGSVKKSLLVKIFKTLIELVMLNLPLLIIRAYISLTFNESISVFLVKNILGIMYCIIEIYDCCFDINKEKTEAEGEPAQAEDSNGNKVDIKDIELSGNSNESFTNQGTV